MDDLLAGIVGASKAWADPVVSAYASGNRRYEVQITRPAGLPTFDRATGAFDNPADTLVYSGPARIHPVSGGPSVQVGDEVADLASVRVSIDATTELDGEGGRLEPRMEDLLRVIPSADADAGHLSNRHFTLTDVEVGGFFSYGWVLTGVGVAPSRRTQ